MSSIKKLIKLKDDQTVELYVFGLLCTVKKKNARLWKENNRIKIIYTVAVWHRDSQLRRSDLEGQWVEEQRSLLRLLVAKSRRIQEMSLRWSWSFPGFRVSSRIRFNWWIINEILRNRLEWGSNTSGWLPLLEVQKGFHEAVKGNSFLQHSARRGSCFPSGFRNWILHES